MVQHHDSHAKQGVSLTPASRVVGVSFPNVDLNDTHGARAGTRNMKLRGELHEEISRNDPV